MTRSTLIALLIVLCGCRTPDNSKNVQNQISNLSAALTDLTHRVDDIERTQDAQGPQSRFATRDDLMTVELQLWAIYKSETNLEATIAAHDPPKK